MLHFQQLGKDCLDVAAPYFAAQNTHIGDFSMGFQFMWNKALRPEYTFAGGCLILREFYAGTHYFHYPLSICGDEAEETAAIEAIEAHCRDSGERLHFTNVPKGRLGALVSRYNDCTVNNRRRWRDYLYRAEDFILYAGKRYAGQRNHVNKFKKSYPGWAFRPCLPSDVPAVLAFLNGYAAENAKDGYLAKEEMDEALAAVPQMEALGMFGGVLTVEGKIVGFSAGERCGDMIVVHLEKALREYEGAYPTLAQAFAQAFCGDGVRFLNRMDDAGDEGLRKSKLQYLPCTLVDKFNVMPKRAIEALAHPPEIETERLVLKAVEDADAVRYARLARDVERNRYWGYDWREDAPADPPAEYFLGLAREDFHRREELSLGIYAEGRLVGEAVLHRFGYRAEAEVGVRVLPEEEGKGYAREAVRALCRYALFKLDLARVEAKCFRENGRSARTLIAAGLLPCGEDATYDYFYMTAAT